MKWTVHARFRQRLLRAEDGRLTAVVQKCAGVYRITGAGGEALARVEPVSPEGLRIGGSLGQGRASLTLAAAPAFLPPRAEALALCWNGIALDLRCGPGNRATLLQNGAPIGRVCGLGLPRALVELAGDAPPVPAAVVYCLADRMYHEGDVDIL